jgi:ribonuclease R
MNIDEKAPTEDKGIISITRKGVGFIDFGDRESLVVRIGDTDTALSGDLVRFQKAGSERGRPAAKVVEIIERGQTTYVGRIVQEEGDWLFYADHKRTKVPFLITKGEQKENVKAVLEFAGWNTEKSLPEGEITEVLGAVGDHEVEMRALLLRGGFEADFPVQVENEAKELEEKGQELLKAGIEGRRDMRGIPTFTIDPVDAKDFDDAISVQTLENGNYEIGIHIADVSYFVKPGMAIDDEGRKRATSVYLVDRTIPMLPHVLSENLCSLRPEEDRLAMSAIFILDKEGVIQDEWYGETAIYSDKRFSYEEAQGVLDAQDGILLEELNILNTLAKKLRARRTKRGAISFDRDEVKIEVDDNGVPVRVYLKERQDTNLLVEDFMLLANEKVSEHMTEVGKTSKTPRPFPYRIHDSPNDEKIKILADFVKVLGYEIPTEKDGGITGKDLNKLFADIEGTDEEYLIKTNAVRSMSKATYSTKNIGHFGLAFDFYSHFTSPIRRYPDLIAHRLIKAHINNRALPQAEVASIDEDLLRSVEREISASEAERDSIKLKQVEFMQQFVGKEFEAVITGAMERGIFVEEQDTRSEGLVSIRSMGDDFYSYDEAKYRLVGQNKGKVYQIGDTVRVRLVKANPIDRLLDFVLVEEKE